MPNILELSDHIRNCINITKDCADTCTESVAYCLNMGGMHVEQSHIRLLLDCTDACNTCSNIMMRGSDYFQSICNACSEICRKCSDSCARLGDLRMRECADICRRCADVCGDMGNRIGERMAA